jgi:hypothetical protein
MLVNDLDLRIIRQSDQSVAMPWVLNLASPSSAATTGDNAVDNIEQVLIAAPTTGIYTARITHKGTLAGGSQIVSVIMSGNLPAFPVLALAQNSATFFHNPGSAAPESLKIYNSGPVTMNYSLKGTQSWMTVDTASKTLAALDSAFLHFSFAAVSFSQWSSYTDTLTLTTNDPAKPSTKIPVTLSTQGPKISAPGAAAFTVDSGAVTIDTFKVRNTGTMPLNVSVIDVDAPPRVWLSIGLPGTIAAGDSAGVQLHIDATALPLASYTASLRISSNDSSTATDTITVTVHVFYGVTIEDEEASLWNLISLPVSTPYSASADLFPGAVTSGFAYAGTYIAADSIKNGPGYWIKLPAAQTYPLQGTSLVIDSVPVLQGWNLIGSISIPVPVSSIGATVAGMVTGEVFGYSRGYRTTDTIQPGKGYWIETNQSGSLILSSTPGPDIPNRITIRHSPDLPPEPPTDGVPAAALPKAYALQEAYPDPFNPVATIEYALPKASFVTLRVYNIIGQEVATLVNGMESAGYKSAKFDGSRLSSGIYFYRIAAGTFTSVKKAVLLK